MSEHGMVEAQPHYTGTSWSGTDWVPRLVHPIGTSSSRRSSSGSNGLHNLHRAPVGKFVPGDQPNRSAGSDPGTREVMHRILNVALICGSLYIIVFLLLLLL